MSPQMKTHATLGDWIAHEAICFPVDDSGRFDAAVDSLIAALGDEVQLLGLGEALHGGEEILTLRNRLFQRLVEAYGYSAIAFESSFPRGRAIDEFVAGCGPADYEAVQEAGFSHGFGPLAANRELVEWMRQYNTDPAHPIKLRFYGADSPTEMTGTDSPRPTLSFALDYLATIDAERARERRERIEGLIGADAAWEDPAALMDPTKGIGLSAAANALRIEVEDLITELAIRRPELVAASDRGRYLEALQHAVVARQLLTYHAVTARESESRLSDLLGIRDAMLADNLTYAVARECGRGKILAFAHTRHVQRSKIAWQLGPHSTSWWLAGAHLAAIFGPRYRVIGTGLGVSAENGIGQPEPGTLEAMLTRDPATACFIPTSQGAGLPTTEIATLSVRSGSAKNSSYMPLGTESFEDFDWLAILPTVDYQHGGWPLPD